MRWLVVMAFERAESIGMDLASELEALGHEVRRFAYRRHNVLYKNKSTKATYQRLIARRLVTRAAAWRPDVVLVAKGSALPAPVLADLRARTGARLVNVFPDNPLWMMDFESIEAYDVFFTKESYALDQLRLAGLENVHYLAPWCVPSDHHPVELHENEEAALRGVVALVGAWYPYRERFLAAIADYPVRVWGPGWTRCRDSRVRAMVRGGAVRGRAKLAIYSGATLSLNVHHPMNDIVGVNNRTFELAAAAACQLVNLKEDLGALFKPGQEVVGFGDLAELKQQMDYYLARPDEARAIGENARRRALAEHTARHRIEEIIAVLDQRFGLAS
ncbi:MAG: glycosyltransferase [Candidatus Rokubacteria bacterium]|nr:glycosyltransferase [Candidatus Rokubacteria bacterium]